GQLHVELPEPDPAVGQQGGADRGDHAALPVPAAVRRLQRAERAGRAGRGGALRPAVRPAPAGGVAPAGSPAGGPWRIASTGSSAIGSAWSRHWRQLTRANRVARFWLASGP